MHQLCPEKLAGGVLHLDLIAEFVRTYVFQAADRRHFEGQVAVDQGHIGVANPNIPVVKGQQHAVFVTLGRAGAVPSRKAVVTLGVECVFAVVTASGVVFFIDIIQRLNEDIVASVFDGTGHGDGSGCII